MKLAFLTFFALAVAASVSGIEYNGPVLHGLVTHVIDGDTADVRLQSGSIRVRFHGIDAPEKAQRGGHEATEALAQIVLGKEVDLAVAEQRDGYGRLVAVVLVGDEDINAELVRDGYAYAYRKYLGLLDGDDEYCD